MMRAVISRAAIVAAVLSCAIDGWAATSTSELVLAVPPAASAPSNSVPASPQAITDPAQVEGIFRQVIAAPEFNEQAQTDLIARLREVIVSWLQSLPDSFSAFKYAENLTRLTYVVMWAILLTAAIAVLYWIQKVIRLQGEDDDAGAPKPVGQRFFAAPESYEPEIAKAIAASSWPEAMTWSWRRFLAQLETRDLVDADRTRTNWEYLAQLRKHPAAVKMETQLRDLAVAYDCHIYGSRPLSTEQWSTFERGLAQASAELQLESSRGQ